MGGTGERRSRRKSRVVDDVPTVGLTDDYLWRLRCFPSEEEPLT